MNLFKVDIGRALGCGFCVFCGTRRSKKWAVRVSEDPPLRSIRRLNRYTCISSCLPEIAQVENSINSKEETEVGAWSIKTLAIDIYKDWIKFFLVQSKQKVKRLMCALKRKDKKKPLFLLIWKYQEYCIFWNDLLLEPGKCFGKLLAKSLYAKKDSLNEVST